MELQKSGVTDPIELTDGISNAYFEQGLAEEGLKYYNAAQDYRKHKAEPLLLQGINIGEQNPQAMVKLLQQAHDVMGDGTKIALAGSPTGGLQLNVNGQVADFPDANQLHHYVMQTYEPVLFGGAEEYGKYQIEKTKGEAAAGSDIARANLADVQATDLVPAQVLETQAAAGAHRAQAGESGARSQLMGIQGETEKQQGIYYGKLADRAGVEAELARPKTEADIEQSQAAAALNRKTASQMGKPTPKSFSEMVRENLVGQEPLTKGIPPASTNPDLRLQVGSSMRNANPSMNDETLYGMSAQLLDEAQAGRLHVDKATGSIVTRDGQAINLDEQGRRALASVAPPSQAKAGAAAGIGQ